MGGETAGTHFPALETPLENRKRWIFGGTTPEGRMVVDAGAARALRENGRSLLPAGIVAVEGQFERGDTVLIVGPKGAGWRAASSATAAPTCNGSRAAGRTRSPTVWATRTARWRCIATI